MFVVVWSDAGDRECRQEFPNFEAAARFFLNKRATYPVRDVMLWSLPGKPGQVSDPSEGEDK